MAVSGRELADFSGSLSHGSAEDIDYNCDPCLTTGKHVDAHKYCVECEEFLCRNCSDCHLKTKASKNHQLVDKDNVSKQHTTKNSEVCTEKCPEHKQEVIKYFCPQHEIIGCHVCMIMSHKICKVEYISDKCANIANSEEYRRTVQRINFKLLELNEITKTTKIRDQEIDKCHHNLLQKINKVRKEINNYIDQLQQKIQKKADKKKTEDMQITKKIRDGCNRLSLDIKNMQSTMQAYETSGKYGQLYIAVKQAQSFLGSDKIKADDGLERTAQQYILECNDSLTDMLYKQDEFGKLSLTPVLKPLRRNMKPCRKLTIKEDINVSTKSDNTECWITGCAVLSSGKLVLVDGHNDKLKLVNMYTKSVVEETLLTTEGTSLNLNTWDVAVLPQDQIAVTKPDKREVVIMICSDRLSTVRTISVAGRCLGITYHLGQLYVICVDPLCVLVLDKQGNVKNKISLDTNIFSRPYYLVVGEDSKFFYISDNGKNCVVSITVQGEVTAVYKHEDLNSPREMLMLDDGSMLVCCYNGTIHHISGDLKQGQTVTDGLTVLCSMCYNHHLEEVYIGTQRNVLTVLLPQ